MRKVVFRGNVNLCTVVVMIPNITHSLLLRSSSFFARQVVVETTKYNVLYCLLNFFGVENHFHSFNSILVIEMGHLI